MTGLECSIWKPFHLDKLKQLYLKSNEYIHSHFFKCGVIFSDMRYLQRGQIGVCAKKQKIYPELMSVTDYTAMR